MTMMQAAIRLAVVLSGCVCLTGCLALPAYISAELAPAKAGESNSYAARPTVGERSGRGSAAPVSNTVPPNHPDTRRDVSRRDLPLASGQIVVMDDGDATGLFVSLFAEEYVPWSHVGIVAIEADGPVVYDTNGGFVPVPGLPPTATFSGGMRRVPFAEYFSRQRIIGIYALPPGVDAGKVVAFARQQYALGTPFDPVFNTGDASALYCSELVALAQQAAGAAPLRPTPVRNNHSYAVLREWLRIRTSSLFLPGNMIDPARQVALWSADLSPVQIEAYFEIRRELTRRFDAQTRLGHLFRWTGTTLVLRDEPRRFVDDSLAAFASYTGNTGNIRNEVRRLADLFFSSPTTTKSTQTFGNLQPYAASY
jgi:hypothetical protein